MFFAELASDDTLEVLRSILYRYVQRQPGWWGAGSRDRQLEPVSADDRHLEIKNYRFSIN
jgi:hypothetical protein